MQNLNELRQIEVKWQQYWEENNIYKFDEQSDKPIYSIDTPPPTVSGNMHIGHAFSYTHTDFIARYKRMKGCNVFYPFGFDDNGLATERLVEKNRNILAKNFTREEFIKICQEETKIVEERMRKQFGLLGLSVDWSLVYRTIDEWCRKTAQRSFIDLYRIGRVYLKEAPTMWCPKCETAIAQAELEDEQIESTFNDIYFELEDCSKIIIATTRPELLGACVAIFVNPADNKNNHLIGKKAKVPLYNYYVPILADHRVDPQKGSGIVMCCTFGDQTDIEWYLAHNLPLKIAISKDGKMTKIAGKYEGMDIKSARKKILEDLKKEGFLVSQKNIIHTVNVHERCKTEVEFLVSKQWFVRYLDLKDEFIVRGEELNWYPEHMRHRYNNWIKGLQWDWCISRQRFFGVPFPVWYCKKCGEVKLADEDELPVDPLVDKPKTKCKCGSNEFEPEDDVLDTWFTSSLTPQINAKWREDEKYFRKIFPMSMRPQAHDIITLWAFNTIVKAHMHNGCLPWKDIVISGHALDPKGRKMSKSLGNVVDPEEIINKYSADILRYWSASASLGEDLPFQEKEFVAGKKFINKLKNAAKFVMVACENFELEEHKEYKLRLSDKWILSKLNKMKRFATECFEKYEFSKALAAIRNFFWLEFADFYIEEVKYRIYGNDYESKEAAQYTLYKVINDLIKLIAPFMPHICEEIYKEILKGKKLSVHLEEWPTVNENLIDEIAEQKGEIVKEVISSIRKYKTINNMSMNQEITEVILITKDDKIKSALDESIEDITKTMNIKRLRIEKKLLNEKTNQISENLHILIKK
ncbi:MAG: valine--tRNA ligase [Candidatus Diapherotrites archaeon]|nr:valine--tRNA ligase [Candidatus Diapherotrites archaeon]